MPVFVFIIKVILNYLFFHLCCKYIEKFRYLWCFLLISCFLTINNHTYLIFVFRSIDLKEYFKNILISIS